jgi:hypothetical protein
MNNLFWSQGPPKLSFHDSTMNPNTSNSAVLPHFDVRVAVRKKYRPAFKYGELGHVAYHFLHAARKRKGFPARPDGFQFAPKALVLRMKPTQAIRVVFEPTPRKRAEMRLETLTDFHSDRMRLNLLRVFLPIMRTAKTIGVMAALTFRKRAKARLEPRADFVKFYFVDVLLAIVDIAKATCPLSASTSRERAFCFHERILVESAVQVKG